MGTTTDIFPFPSVGAPSPAVVGAGDIIGVFSDRPEVREVVRYMLSPEYGRGLSAASPYLSPNRRFDLSNYEPFERHQAEIIDAALADTPPKAPTASTPSSPSSMRPGPTTGEAFRSSSSVPVARCR